MLSFAFLVLVSLSLAASPDEELVNYLFEIAELFAEDLKRYSEVDRRILRDAYADKGERLAFGVEDFEHIFGPIQFQQILQKNEEMKTVLDKKTANNFIKIVGEMLFVANDEEYPYWSDDSKKDQIKLKIKKVNARKQKKNEL